MASTVGSTLAAVGVGAISRGVIAGAKEVAVAGFRKWWLMALVVTAALSLTSCSKRSNQLSADFGFYPCQGNLGLFDVYVINSSQGTGVYQLTIISASPSQPGDVVSIWLASSSSGAAQPMAGPVILMPEQEISGGNLTDADLQIFDSVLIAPYDATNQRIATAYDTYCTLPMLGDGVGYGYR